VDNKNQKLKSYKNQEQPNNIRDKEFEKKNKMNFFDTKNHSGRDGSFWVAKRRLKLIEVSIYSRRGQPRTKPMTTMEVLGLRVVQN